MSPASYVIKVFGGVRETARAIGRSPSSVSKWTKSREQRGCAGKVPGAAQRLILRAAIRLRLDIKPEDLVVGRNTKK